MHVCERESVCMCMHVCVCMCVRESVCVCMCMCVCAHGASSVATLTNCAGRRPQPLKSQHHMHTHMP